MGEKRNDRVYVSSVSHEFAFAIAELKQCLEVRGLEVLAYDDLPESLGTGTPLSRAQAFIRDDCFAVICLIGARSGAIPSAEEAAPFAEMLPPAFSRLTEPQWNLFFALHHKRKLSIYVADETYPASPAPPGTEDHPAVQAEYLTYLERLGLELNPFDTDDTLCEKVMEEPWPEPFADRPKPVYLPYRSLGILFKGREGILSDLRAHLKSSINALAGMALHGPNGVGKTRLAVEYAWHHESIYTGLFFVSGATPVDLRRRLRACPTRLGSTCLSKRRAWSRSGWRPPCNGFMTTRAG